MVTEAADLQMSILHAYEGIAADIPVPFVEFLAPPNFRSPVVNTDGLGQRFSNTESEGRFSYEDRTEGLIVGGSAALGVGATRDQMTLASQLSNITKVRFSTLAARAWILPQALALETFTRPSRRHCTVILAGINELAVLAQGAGHPSLLPAPYYWRPKNGASHYSLARIFRGGLYNKREKYSPNSAGHLFREYLPSLVGAALAHFRQWSEIVIFALQPFRLWLEHPLVELESELASLQSLNQSNLDRQVLEMIGSHHDLLVQHLSDICALNEVQFVDLQQEIVEFNIRERRPIFADSVHLTDEGYLAVSKVISRKLGMA